MEQFKTLNDSILLVKKCIDNNNDSAYQNVADQYLPIGPQTLKDHKLDWNRVYQALMEDLYQLSAGKTNSDSLLETIKTAISGDRSTRALVDVIGQLYASPDAINGITPLTCLVSNTDSLSARTKTMIGIVQGLLSEPLRPELNLAGNNPIESLIIKNVHLLCEQKPFDPDRSSYLPFLGKMFSEDLVTISKSSGYFLSELESFLNIYTFVYLTQLTIHLCIPANRYQVPSAKPLYFILETEGASRERHECNQFGYDYIFSSTRGLALGVFPYLGYFSRVSKSPSWDIAREDSTKFLSKVNEFNSELAILFGETYQDKVTLQGALNEGASFQKQMFDETLQNSKKGSRKTANKKVIEIFERIFSAGFITDRKAAGKYFVLNSNTLLLLTNLVIGGSGKSKLLIDDILEGFKSRGVFFDTKSKKALLTFYENVGNIEKLSDSGDAVYVKATI